MQLESSCNETYLISIIGLNVTHNHPPRHNPATCINTTNTTGNCQDYIFISNIMLGQNIKINACMLSLYCTINLLEV